MTINEALNAAIAGGYRVEGFDGVKTSCSGVNSDYSAWTRKDTQSSFLVPMQETFLDPAFWHALGWALGWDAPCDLTLTCGQGNAESWLCHGSPSAFGTTWS
jgi:hypothetical protein